MLSEPPLVGRDEELGQLGSILHKVTLGSGRLVLLSGEAGIGKTRLATEFEKRARTSGFKVLFGGCLPSAQIPYLVFLDALSDLFDEEAEQRRESRSSKLAGAAKKAAPEFLKAIPLIGTTMKASATLFTKYAGEGGAKEVSKEHVLFRTLDLLRSESGKRPLIIHLDDLQWADSMSIAMLHFLARNCRDMRVMLLGTYRSEEVLNKEGGIHPFLESIRIMKREGLVEELHLKPLGEKELNQVVSGMMERPIHALVLERIFKESGGSPLFAVETVRLLDSMGALILKDGKLNIAGRIEDKIPSSVKEVIQRRIERTSKEERKVLDYASVIGLNFNPQLLAGALRMEQLPVLETLERLQNEHQLLLESETGYSFTHEKVQRFTYEGISALRRRELHRTVGGLIEQQLPNDMLYPDLARHFYSAKEDEKAVKYSYHAGHYCLRNHALTEAIPNFERVLELGPKTKGFETYKLPTMEGLGDALQSGGDAASGAKMFECMLETDVGGLQKVRVLRKLANCWLPNRLGKGSKTKSLEYATMARQMTEVDDLEEAEIYSILKVLATSEGDWTEAKRLGQAAEDAFRRAKDDRELCYQLIYNCSMLITACEMDASFRKLDMAEEINRSMQDVDINMELNLYRGLTYFHVGMAEEAMSHFSACAEIAKKLGVDSVLSIVHFYQSLQMSIMGDFEMAADLATRSREYADKIKRDFLKAGADAALAHANFKLGNNAESKKYASEAMEIANNLDKKLKAVNIGMALNSMAEVALVGNDWTTAQQHYVKAIAVLESCIIGRLMEGVVMTWYAEALRTHGDYAEAVRQLTAAQAVFETLGNQEQMQRCKQALGAIGH